MSITALGMVPDENPLTKIINADHLNKIIENSDKDCEREYKDKEDERSFIKNENIRKQGYTLVYTIIGVLLFLFLTIFLIDKHENLYYDIVKIGLGFLAGLGLGNSSTMKKAFLEKMN